MPKPKRAKDPAQTRLPDAVSGRVSSAVPPRSANRRWLIVAGTLLVIPAAGWGGWQWLQQSQTRAALASLQPVAELVPAEQPERREAMQLADRLLREFPNSPPALYARGTLLLRHGFSEEATKTWKACLKLAPDLAPAYEFLGIEASQRGDNEQAVEYLRKAIELDPELPAAGLYLGEALNNLGRMAEAVPILEQFIKVAPRTGEPYFQLGQAYLYLKDHARAKSCYQAALREDPEFAQACFGLAQACERLGEKELAQEYRQKHVTMISRGRTAAQRHVRSGRSAAEAREALAAAYETASKVYLAHGKADEARACLDKAAAVSRQTTAAEAALKPAGSSDALAPAGRGAEANREAR